MKAALLDFATIDQAIDLTPIADKFDEFESFSITAAEQTVSRCRSLDVVLTNKVVFDEAIISQLPNLKLICVLATGVNNIDITAAKAAGIAVANVSGYSTYSVAQYLFAYLLNHTNQVELYLNQNRRQPWNKSSIFCQAHVPMEELHGKKFGILGYGAIGKKVSQIARAFGMEIIIAERPAAKSIREGRVSFEQMLGSADIVSVHCPLTDESHNLFDEMAFSTMKTGSIFINTGRGPIVDSKALAKSLIQGHLSHAIIDVLEVEPPEEGHPLLDADIPNLTLTHHIAWASIQAQRQLIQMVENNIDAFCNGKQLNRVDLD